MLLLLLLFACFVQEAEALALELEELKREQNSYTQQIEAVNEAIKLFQEQIEVISAEVAKNKVSLAILI